MALGVKEAVTSCPWNTSLVFLYNKNTISNGESNITSVLYWSLSVNVSVNCVWNIWMLPLSWLKTKQWPCFCDLQPISSSEYHYKAGEKKDLRSTEKSTTVLSPYSLQICTDLRSQGWLALRCQDSKMPSLSWQLANFRSSIRKMKITLLKESSLSSSNN